MKNIKQQLFFLIICIVPIMQAQAGTVSFSAVSTSFLPGESLDISIFAKEFDELAGGTIDFSLSSLSSISISDVSIDSHWDFNPETGSLDGTTWKGLGFDVFSNEPLNGDGLIATISITGIKAGDTTLTLLDSSTFFTRTDSLITSEIINNRGFDVAVNSVSEVPLPAAAWYMGSALIGLIGLRKKPL